MASGYGAWSENSSSSGELAREQPVARFTVVGSITAALGSGGYGLRAGCSGRERRTVRVAVSTGPWQSAGMAVGATRSLSGQGGRVTKGLTGATMATRARRSSRGIGRRVRWRRGREELGAGVAWVVFSASGAGVSVATAATSRGKGRTNGSSPALVSRGALRCVEAVRGGGRGRRRRRRGRPSREEGGAGPAGWHGRGGVPADGGGTRSVSSGEAAPATASAPRR